MVSSKTGSNAEALLQTCEPQALPQLIVVLIKNADDTKLFETA